MITEKISVELEFDRTALNERRSMYMSAHIGKGTLDGEEFSIAQRLDGTGFEVSFEGGRVANVDIKPVIEELVRQAKRSGT